MKHGGYDKIEVKANVGKHGGIGKSEENSDQSPEYWSERAVRKLPLKELYPKAEGETDADYADRLMAIKLELDAKQPNIEEGKTYYYGPVDADGRPITRDENGKSTVRLKKRIGQKTVELIRGFRFRRHQDQARGSRIRAYANLFRQQIEAESIEDALSDAAKARNPESSAHIPTPREIRQQKRLNRSYGSLRTIADYYMGRPGGQFRGWFDRRYTDEDRNFVAQRAADFKEKDRRAENNKGRQNAGELLEGFFYPLVESGFFGAEGLTHSAAPIITSEYDDYKNGVDAAALLPIHGLESPQVFCFDLTTGSGKDKNDRISQHMKAGQGFAHLKYSATCLDRVMPEMRAPHFVLCLPPTEAGELETGLAIDDSVPSHIGDLINYQIYIQADYWRRHYEARDGETQAAFFASTADHFYRRIPENIRDTDIDAYFVKHHPIATGFLFRNFDAGRKSG